MVNLVTVLVPLNPRAIFLNSLFFSDHFKFFFSSSFMCNCTVVKRKRCGLASIFIALLCFGAALFLPELIDSALQDQLKDDVRLAF